MAQVPLLLRHSEGSCCGVHKWILQKGLRLTLPFLYSLYPPAGSSASSQGLEACSAVSSTPCGAPVLQLSDSDKLDVVSIEAGDIEESPPNTHTYEELLEIVTHVISRLNIDRLAEKQEVCQQSLLDERFLPSTLQPSRLGFPFFPDLHTVSWSWKNPVSYCVFSPQTSNYLSSNYLTSGGSSSTECELLIQSAAEVQLPHRKTRDQGSAHNRSLQRI